MILASREGLRLRAGSRGLEAQLEAAGSNPLLAEAACWKQPAAAPAELELELELELEPEGLLLTDTCESPLTVFAGGAASRAHRADSAYSEADSVSAELRALVAQGALTEAQARIILDATPV